MALQTPAHIYYKYEGVSPAGSHKPNTALAQAFYNKEAGVKRLATETGAGQWGSALAFAGAVFGLDVKVYMFTKADSALGSSMLNFARAVDKPVAATVAVPTR